MERTLIKKCIACFCISALVLSVVCVDTVYAKNDKEKKEHSNNGKSDQAHEKNANHKALLAKQKHEAKNVVADSRDDAVLELSTARTKKELRLNRHMNTYENTLILSYLNNSIEQLHMKRQELYQTN